MVTQMFDIFIIIFAVTEILGGNAIVVVKIINSSTLRISLAETKMCTKQRKSVGVEVYLPGTAKSLGSSVRQWELCTLVCCNKYSRCPIPMVMQMFDIFIIIFAVTEILGGNTIVVVKIVNSSTLRISLA